MSDQPASAGIPLNEYRFTTPAVGSGYYIVMAQTERQAYNYMNVEYGVDAWLGMFDMQMPEDVGEFNRWHQEDESIATINLIDRTIFIDGELKDLE